MKEYVAYLEQSVASLQLVEKELTETARKDEANLTKVKMNVYGICQAMWEAVSKADGKETLKEAYLKKLDGLSRSWTDSQTKAREHDDVKKSVIEELKLQALEDARSTFLRLWEGACI